MRADYAEANPLMEDLVGGFRYQLARTVDVLESLSDACPVAGTVAQSPAQALPLPSDSVHAIITDPPYYFSIPYADLSDMFYVWLRRFLAYRGDSFLKCEVTPKDLEATQSLPHSKSPSKKDKKHYEEAIRESFLRARDALRPDGISVVVFAHASTAGWEALVQGLIAAGWKITASWPIETENRGRMLANRQRTLASSVHLVCRPRELSDGSDHDAVGDWRDVLSELPRRIHDWMPRLAAEGIVGADAIFACLGPALEIYSKYSKVETASGESIPLGDQKDMAGSIITRGYLSYVWEAVAKEALNMIFEGAETAGFEEDARLTAMWLWTLSTGGNGTNGEDDDAADANEEDEESGSKSTAKGGFVLEYDAARKIAQGLGAHLEQLASVVDIKGDKARLRTVAERTKHLFGKDEGSAPAKSRRRKPAQQMLFEPLDEIEEEQGGWGDKSVPELGNTVLDRIHQSMILFAAGRGEALKRFLVEDGVGRDARYWRLAQALSALYPAGTDEKRWVDGVLARKKGLGF